MFYIKCIKYNFISGKKRERINNEPRGTNTKKVGHLVPKPAVLVYSGNTRRLEHTKLLVNKMASSYNKKLRLLKNNLLEFQNIAHINGESSNSL